MAQKIWDAVIVGGGHNGLVAAAYLARADLDVLVLERREVLGGACVTEEIFPGFKISTAAYLCGLLNHRITQELELERHGYHVVAKDPTFFTPFPDGRYLFMWQDRDKTCEEIAKFSIKDAEKFPLYEDFIERLSRFVEQLFLKTPPDLIGTGAKDLFSLSGLAWGFSHLRQEEKKGLLDLFTRSAADFLDSWFESEELKATLVTDGVIGANAGPRSPGTAYILLHHVMGNIAGQRGVWGFVRGGMGMVSQALAAAAREGGATIRTSAAVERILVDDGQAAGVVLEKGEEIRACMVVSNADPKRTFLGLIEEQELGSEFVSQVRAIGMKGCSMKINLALEGLPDFKALPGSGLMPHHRTTMHICPTVDYLERAWDDAKYGRPSRRPLLEMTIPTVYDPSLAPPEKHIMGIFLQYTPYDLREGQWSEATKEAYADRVLDLVEEEAPGFKSLVMDRQVLSPLDLETRFGLTGGNIFHGEMNLGQLFSLRPLPGWSQYRTPVRNLYLCGSGTHPGGGVMGSPGYNASRQILRDWRRWPRIFRI